jgi:hypothetical protein
LKIIFLEMKRVKSDTKLPTYTRQQVESRLSIQYAPWFGTFGNHSQAQAIIKIFEDNYLPPGTADDDHLAWLQFAVDVRINIKGIGIKSL